MLGIRLPGQFLKKCSKLDFQVSISQFGLCPKIGLKLSFENGTPRDRKGKKTPSLPHLKYVDL